MERVMPHRKVMISDTTVRTLGFIKRRRCNRTAYYRFGVWYNEKKHQTLNLMFLMQFSFVAGRDRPPSLRASTDAINILQRIHLQDETEAIRLRLPACRLKLLAVAQASEGHRKIKLT
jgi:hypothetical protein